MKQRVLPLSLCLVVLAGCQKVGLTESTSSLDVSAASAMCASTSSADLSIVGESQGEAGSSMAYAAAQNGNCVNNVTWKAAGASAAKSSSAGLVSTYRKAGSYVVTAQSKAVSGQTASIMTTVVKESIEIAGPQVGFKFNPLNYSLVFPTGVAPMTIAWDFGDGSVTVDGRTTVEHTFFKTGEFNLKVVVTDTEGVVHNLTRRVTITEVVDNMACISDLAISGAKEAKVNVATDLTVFLPSCLASRVGAIRWNFGDGSSATNQSVSHAYTATGSYAVTATLYLGDSQTAWVTLDHSINVIQDLEEEPVEEPPVDPNACSVSGEVRTSDGEISSSEVACGLDGLKTVSYREKVKEECKLVGEKLNWVEVSREKQITNEGACKGQSCQLPDGSKLADGGSKVLYTSSTPAGTCASVAETRMCNNGVLSGSTAANQLVCHNGCGDFGVHGSVKTGVVTGSMQVAKECSYGETGFFDTFTQVSDQTCTDGNVVNSNTRKGTLKEAGSCPVYGFVPSENYTTCSADCGGKQTRIYLCKDDKGVTVDNSRCGTQVAPIEERLCDANPEAVRRQESATAVEEANSSAKCPSNQIGVIINTRDVVTTETYACIDHSVQLESKVSVPSAWVETKYCRDYVAHRCSQDSLSNSEAEGRYQWMLKCKEQLPVVKEFLDKFENVSIKLSGQAISVGNNGGREMYASFMDRAFTPEKAWIAPKKASAACAMPATAYVATVCVSSCATPEQQILAEVEAGKKMQYQTFIDALTQKSAYVATLKNADSVKSKAVSKVKVDQWVTELVDSEHEILIFKMKSGRELRVTKNHPVLAQDGSMKVAEEFKVGESLVQLGGDLDKIQSITPIKHQGKVYNLFVQSNEPAKNIVVTNGYLNGTAYFQNTGAKDMNRNLFRNNMTRGVFGK